MIYKTDFWAKKKEAAAGGRGEFYIRNLAMIRIGKSKHIRQKHQGMMNRRCVADASQLM
ncbi:MAG: hypothetical protein ACLVAT_03235 [Lachnospiraceae bacterium]